MTEQSAKVDTGSLPRLLSVPRGAALLGIPRATAYQLAASGELPSRRLGGRIYLITAKLLEIVGEAA